jgi:N-acetylglucosamine kinase-like BadF-type ATPase
MEASARVIAEAIAAASAEAGIELDGGPIAPTGVFCLAGADFPVDDLRIARALGHYGWTGRTIVRNDTFAVLRAGTDTAWGVAVVCGAGMNCIGLAPDGRTVRFPALGELSGDWAPGGGWVGRRALGAALRARDGRGPRTELEHSLPAHFGMSRPAAVMEAIYQGRLDDDRLLEAAPLVFRAASAGDRVARGILDEMADEVVAWAVAAIRKLRLASRPTDMILGGGMFRPDDPALLERIRDGVARAAPRAEVRKLEGPPVVGAALLGLDDIGGSARAAARLRSSLSFDRLDGTRRSRGAR